MGLADWFRSNRFSSTNSLSGDVDPDADLAIQRSGTKPGTGRGERAAAYMSEPESIAKSYFVVAGITGERKYAANRPRVTKEQSTATPLSGIDTSKEYPGADDLEF